MRYPFSAPLAHLGVDAPDRRWLNPEGSWTLANGAFIHGRDDFEPLGWILGLEVVSHVLWAVGDTGDGGLAADLDGGQRALSANWDSIEFGPELRPRFEIRAGRIRSAMVVEPSAYLWAGPS